MTRPWLNRADIAVGIAIGLMLALVTWLVYVDGGTQGSLIHFYYIPIVTASYFLADLGAIVTAFAAALLAAILPLRTLDAAPQPFKDILIRAALYYFIGLVTSRLFAKLEQRREDAASLLDLSRSVNASLRPAEVLRTIAETAVAITSAKACSIRLLTRDGDELTTAASYGLSLDYLAKGPVRTAESPIDREVLEGHPAAVLDATKDPRFRYRDEARREGIVSVLCLPLRSRNEVFGVLRVYSAVRHQWSRREQRLLEAFSDHAAIAIYNARLHQDLRRSYWETVSALARAIEAKDAYTLGHSERVTDYALQLGTALDLSDDQMETLRFAATLHDVGKIGLTDESLSRSGRLDTADDVAVHMHPLIGLSILQPVEFLAPVLSAVRYHHEHWDGTGYSEGLAGEKIPLLARIIAVADYYEHLRTGSPGRPGLSPQQAARALRQAAGSRLDPALTDRFLRSLAQESARPAPEERSAPGRESV
jgi:response regulator RpfG family c-di-GMP phosphodiesterase